MWTRFFGWPEEYKRWFALGVPRQREVIRLARGGQRHPDARVSAVAYEWAMWRLARFDAYRRRQFAVAAVAVTLGTVAVVRGENGFGLLALAGLVPVLLAQSRRTYEQVFEANGFRR